MSENYKHFQNSNCEYFPCHKLKNPSNFNCLFCFCPLYTLGSKCGGNFKYRENGVKDCSQCILPHCEKGYEHIMSKWSEISNLAKENK